MTEIELVMAAADFAARAHSKQRRLGAAREPYINHPIEVAKLVNEVTDDPHTIAAALLHDVIEDCEVPLAFLKKTFGNRVAALVAEVTDDKAIPKAERKQLQIASASKITRGAKLIRLADKISNVRTIAYSPPVGWDRARRLEYILFAKQVVAELRDVSPFLATEFDFIAELAGGKLNEGS